MRKSKHYRSIIVNDEEWRWKVGSSFVSIRGPNNESYSPSLEEITGSSDSERDRYKGNLHVTPSQIETYISRISIDFLPTLKDVFYERRGATYLAGTLIVSIDDEKPVFFNLIDKAKFEKPEEVVWIALNYIKYKTTAAHYYQKSIRIVEDAGYKKELAIALLKSIEEGV